MNIDSYFQYYGDISFDDFKFNDVDSLILAMLSYVKMENIVPTDKKQYIYIEEACYKFFLKYSEKDFKKENWLFPNSYRLMQRLQKSKRFYHTKLYYFQDSVSASGQFGALTVRLPNHITYVSFEGTDSNVSGWKEDFQLIYQFPIHSHVLARNYLDSTLNIFDREIYIGGHSKGGNLAMYACMYCKDFYKKRVRCVYNFDGPGFLSDVIDSSLYQDMSSKLKTFVPEESVVGMLLGHTKYQVVRSTGRAILQHDAYTWECFGGCFVEADLSSKSKKLEKNLSEYLTSMSIEDRKSFVETFFAIFENTSITNIMQLKELKISTLLGLMKELKNVPTKTKSNLIAVLRMLIMGMN